MALVSRTLNFLFCLILTNFNLDSNMWLVATILESTASPENENRSRFFPPARYD